MSWKIPFTHNWGDVVTSGDFSSALSLIAKAADRASEQFRKVSAATSLFTESWKNFLNADSGHGTEGQVLRTDGVGKLTWAAPDDSDDWFAEKLAQANTQIALANGEKNKPMNVRLRPIEQRPLMLRVSPRTWVRLK